MKYYNKPFVSIKEGKNAAVAKKILLSSYMVYLATAENSPYFDVNTICLYRLNCFLERLILIGVILVMLLLFMIS